MGVSIKFIWCFSCIYKRNAAIPVIAKIVDVTNSYSVNSDLQVDSRYEDEIILFFDISINTVNNDLEHFFGIKI